MKGLTPGEYSCLQRIDQMQAAGWLLGTIKPNSDAERLVARGVLALQDSQWCVCGRCRGFLPTPAGRLAMRCYELEHRSLDLGIAS